MGETTQPLPAFVRVGLYEEFPTPERLAKLTQVDFPVTLAVAATSRATFVQLCESIQRDYPQVREVFFWPLLAREQGYYPGPFSDPDAVRRAMVEAADLPTLWDLELPRDLKYVARPLLRSWAQNRTATAAWLRGRMLQVHTWRTFPALGINPRLLRLLGLHYDPCDYPAVSMQLDLYTTGTGQPERALQHLLRRGVVHYGARFIPSFGVLNDGEGPDELFVPPETLQRNLRIARAAGVSEMWLFGVNGLNAAYLEALRAELPLEPLPAT